MSGFKTGLMLVGGALLAGAALKQLSAATAGAPQGARTDFDPFEPRSASAADEKEHGGGWLPGSAPVDPKEPTAPSTSAQDIEALGRMLASEDSRSSDAQTVIGWITIQVAKRRKQSVYKLLTQGAGYGGQVRTISGKRKAFYASTARPATDETRERARQLLAGTLMPSSEIRKHRPGPWVERNQGLSDERLIDLQAKWKAGIYARVAGTRWVLYSPDAPRITEAPLTSASARLDAVPELPALARGPAVA